MAPLTTALLLCLLALLAVPGYFVLFGSGLASYDDEGTMMMMVRSYLDGHALYDQIFTQYGPFYYHVYALLHGPLGIPLTNDGVRWIVLGIELVLTGICFLLVHHLTRSRVAGLLAAVPFFWMVTTMAGEPAHPQGLVLLLIGGMLLAPALLGVGPRLFAALGAMLAALLLVKVNVGVYAAIAVLWAMLAHSAKSGWTVGAGAVLAAGCLCLPAVVMRTNLADNWEFQKYAMLATASFVPVVALMVRPATSVLVAGRAWLWLGASAAMAAAAIAVPMLLAGTSFTALAEGVLLHNLRFPALFPDPVYVAAAVAFPAAALSITLFGVWLFLHRASHGNGTARGLRFALRTFFGLGTVYFVLAGNLDGLWNVMSPFIWVALVPPPDGTGDTAGRQFMRTLLPLTAAFQILHAYPIAGAQVAWALIWMVPAALVALHDAWDELSRTAARPSRIIRWRTAMAAALAIVAVAISVGRTQDAAELYLRREPLMLPGAERVRADPAAVAGYRWLTEMLRTHADTFIGYPGFNSLYFWTGIEPPTPMNLGLWMGHLDDRRQQTIVDALDRYPRAVVVRNLANRFFVPAHRFHDRRLVVYLREQFHIVARHGPYELMVRKERDLAVR